VFRVYFLLLKFSDSPFALTGANFEFYPANSQLTVVEPNAFFEPLFYQNQSKHPDIKMEKFVLASAEDMKGVEDGSVDIVVSTLVLCSVRSLEKTLQEVHRILAPVILLIVIF
jgi:SAM-dependent methyltransferase